MIGRLVHTADFQRLLSTKPKSRSAHFAVHYLSARPSLPPKPKGKGVNGELSTTQSVPIQKTVDKLIAGHWLGVVVPKRHAKCSVTRNAIKRQMRQALCRQEKTLPAGLWLVRLKAPFARAAFLSPQSTVLRTSAAGELDDMLLRAAA